MSETGSTTDSKIIYFSGALIKNDYGITITDGMVNNVANPFLDLSDILTGEKNKFYFLADDDTYYDQIVLENLYNTLNNIASGKVLDESNKKTEVINLIMDLFIKCFEDLGVTDLKTFEGKKITKDLLVEQRFSRVDDVSNFIRKNVIFDESEMKTYVSKAFTSGDLGEVESLCNLVSNGKYYLLDSTVYNVLLNKLGLEKNGGGIEESKIPECIYLSSPCKKLDESGREVKVYKINDTDKKEIELFYNSAKDCYYSKKADGSFDKSIYDILGLSENKYVKHDNYYSVYKVGNTVYNYGSENGGSNGEISHEYKSSNNESLIVFSDKKSLEDAESGDEYIGEYPKNIKYGDVIYTLETSGNPPSPIKSEDGTCVHYKSSTGKEILVSTLEDIEKCAQGEQKTDEKVNGKHVLYDRDNNVYEWSKDDKCYTDQNGNTLYEHFGIESFQYENIKGTELLKKIFKYKNGGALSDADAEAAYKSWWQGNVINEITLSGGKKLGLKSGSSLKDNEKPEYWGIDLESVKATTKSWQISQLIAAEKNGDIVNSQQNNGNGTTSETYEEFIEGMEQGVCSKIQEKLGEGGIENSEKAKDFISNYSTLVINEIDENRVKYADLIEIIEKAQFDLLNLCLLSSCPRTETTNGKTGYDKEAHEIIAPMDRKEEYSGTYCLASGVERITNPDGSYSYKIVKASGEEGKISADDLKNSFTKVDALFNPDKDGFVTSTISWYAMTIMYEKVAVQQMVLAEQLNQIEKINEEIRYNNKVLSTLSELYTKAYLGAVAKAERDGASTKKINLSDIKWDGTAKDLVDYLENTVKVGEICKDCRYPAWGPEDTGGGPAVAIHMGVARFEVPFAHFNKEGEWVRWQRDKNTENIDVAEQAGLNTISMWQDQVRMYGDKLSTDAQLMTTKMEQYIQNVNSCLTTCTQTVKAVGDLCKAITQNIR